MVLVPNPNPNPNPITLTLTSQEPLVLAPCGPANQPGNANNGSRASPYGPTLTVGPIYVNPEGPLDRTVPEKSQKNANPNPNFA